MRQPAVSTVRQDRASSYPPPAAGCGHELPGAKSHVHLWKDRLIFTAPYIVSEPCSRPAVGILIGTDGDIAVAMPDGAVCSSRALLIAPHAARALAAKHGCYSLILDPVHRLHRYLRCTLLGGHHVLDIGDRLDGEILALAATAARGLGSYRESYLVSEQIMQGLFPGTDDIQPIDTRVDAVADWLRMNVPKSIPMETLAQIAGLSPGRITHLFTEELGLSLRRYLMWIKMRRATELFARNESLTAIAHAIGFADSAHLSRVFKNYFALTPSFLADPARVEFNVCDRA